MDADASSAESTSGDTPSPTIPMTNPGPSRNEPSEEPDPESQGHTGSDANNEMANENERSMDLDYADNVFDDVGAEVESPVAAIPGLRWFDSDSSGVEGSDKDGLDPLLQDPDIPASPDREGSTDSSTDEESDEEGVQEGQEEHARPFPAMPGIHPNPHIAHLINSSQSPYCHSTSEKDIDEMQSLQDYLDGVKDNLSDHDEDNLIAFALRSALGMTAMQYERWRAVFSHRIELESTYKSNSLAQRLSNVSTQETSCCIKSCMAFTGEFAELEACLYCSEPQRNTQGAPRNVSYHYSIIDRLQGMFQDPDQSRSLNRDNVRPNPDPDTLSDKFDGDYFKKLCQRTVQVQGIDTGHRYFTDGREQSLSVSLDGFTFYETLGKHRTKTKYNTWLVIAILDNLDPLTRTRCKNIMVLAIIPGPGSPKDLNSYLYWFQRELHLLSIRVMTWDAALREWFLLRAYLLWLFGDMPAITHIMNMKGHNGMCPCRACYILGSCNITGGKTNYYPVLWQPDRDGRQHHLDISTLLNRNGRTHESFLEDLKEIDEKQESGTKAAWKKSRQESGINGWSILHQIDSIDFPRSFPHDLMHLPALNTIPNFVKIWTGTFSGLEGAGGVVDYLISSQDWKEVGRRTEDANRLIPYAFSRAIPNLAQERPSMNAEAWFFWWLQIAQYALDGILKEPYYSHAMDLVHFIRKCMQFEITRTEVTGPLTEMCYKWVKEYEQLYYQGREDRLASCPSTIHAWLHVPQDILNSGPSWLSWAFPMEREVQWAKAGVKDAKKKPFVYMAGRALQREQIKHLGHHLGISRRLDLDQHIKDMKDGKLGPKREVQEMNYKDFVLCSPRIKSSIIQEHDRLLISHHLVRLYAQDEDLQNDAFNELIPKRAEKWMKVRIAGGGDTAHANDKPFPEGDHRDASFIRYHMIVNELMEVRYGQLHYILKFAIPAFGTHPKKTYILAFIKPCVTNGIDVTVQKTYYREMGPVGVADLTCYVATVGRVPMGEQRYGIIDRSTEEAWPTVYEDAQEPVLGDQLVQL